VDRNQWLAERFEENRGRMRAVAYRMLGSLNEADDAVQEAWIRLSRSDEKSIENLGGWLTTVVSRVCLDMLRSRKSRGEEPIGEQVNEPIASSGPGNDPEREALLADSVGLALLVVLGRLAPAERIAFVLHDMFAVPFEEIALILGRTSTAARQLASRARRRVQGTPKVADANIAEQLDVANAFLSALRAGDVEGLISVLDPDVVVRLGEGAARPGAPAEIRGARNWATGAVSFAAVARFVQPALVNGSVGLVWAPNGHLLRVLTFTLKGGRIDHAEITADPQRLREFNLAALTP
jgi:RNA polymerase sigma factor (sigma-70 family)